MRTELFTNTRTPDEWQAMARREAEKRQESFDRCDTDGFLSQWAYGQMKHRYTDAAAIAANGYTVERYGIFDLAGNQVEAEASEGQYGPYYFIPSAEGKARYFTTSTARNQDTCDRNNAKKGYYWGRVKYAVTISDAGEVKLGDVLEVLDNGQARLKSLGVI